MAVNMTNRATLRTLRYRQNVATLSDAQLIALGQATSAMYGIADERGYAYHAGIHGLPLPISCQHGNLLFLPWHRAYLYFFEQALMDQAAGAQLPWWDWTDHTVGVPNQYAGATLPNGSPNPLAQAPITGIPAAQLATVPIRLPRAQIGGVSTYVTYRRPKLSARLPSPAQVQDVLNAPNFVDFSNRLETNIHNAVHTWTGGTMGLIPLAAFDPVFWAHHTMVDRLWRIWQLSHPTGTPDASMLDVALAPFPMTVRQTLDVNALGYDYAVSVSVNTAPPGR